MPEPTPSPSHPPPALRRDPHGRRRRRVSPGSKSSTSTRPRGLRELPRRCSTPSGGDQVKPARCSAGGAHRDRPRRRAGQRRPCRTARWSGRRRRSSAGPHDGTCSCTATSPACSTGRGGGDRSRAQVAPAGLVPVARGIDEVRWTFDPLIRRNVAFNLVRLGAQVDRYLEDAYGPMPDVRNAGLPDRPARRRWSLAAPRVAAAAAGRAASPDVDALRRSGAEVLLDELDGRQPPRDRHRRAPPAAPRPDRHRTAAARPIPTWRSAWAAAVRDARSGPPLAAGRPRQRRDPRRLVGAHRRRSGHGAARPGPPTGDRSPHRSPRSCVEHVELVRVAMPLVRPFRTSFGTQTARDVLLVHVRDRDGADGLGRVRHHGGTGLRRRLHRRGRVGAARPPRPRGRRPRAPRSAPTTSSPGSRATAATTPRKRRSRLRSGTCSCAPRGASLADHLGVDRDRVPAGVSVGIPTDASGGRTPTRW